MKNIIMLLLATGCLLIFSCSRNDRIIITPKTGMTPNIGAQKDGEDDDRPIIIIKTVTIDNNPISGSSITIYAANDTAIGVTDNSGNCSIYLPHLGQWNLSIVRTQYTPVNTVLNLVDSITTRTDTLILQ